VADLIDIHNALSPTISKLEFLSRLAPILDNQQEYYATLGLILDMQADYIHQLRRTLDDLCGVQP
jgi:hypothetical protein